MYITNVDYGCDMWGIYWVIGWLCTPLWIGAAGVSLHGKHARRIFPTYRVFRSPRAVLRRTTHPKRPWTPDWLLTRWPSIWAGVVPWWSWHRRRPPPFPLRGTCRSQRFSGTSPRRLGCYGRQGHDGRCPGWTRTPTTHVGEEEKSRMRGEAYGVWNNKGLLSRMIISRPFPTKVVK